MAAVRMLVNTYLLVSGAEAERQAHSHGHSMPVAPPCHNHLRELFSEVLMKTDSLCAESKFRDSRMSISAPKLQGRVS